MNIIKLFVTIQICYGVSTVPFELKRMHNNFLFHADELIFYLDDFSQKILNSISLEKFSKNDSVALKLDIQMTLGKTKRIQQQFIYEKNCSVAEVNESNNLEKIFPGLKKDIAYGILCALDRTA